MTRAPETPESPEAAPQPRNNAATPQNPRKTFSPARKALAAAVVGAFILTGAGFASNGFTENPVDAFADQSHSAQASGGAVDTHQAAAKGGLTTVAATPISKPVPPVKTLPVTVPVDVQHPVSEQYATVSIPRLGNGWVHYLVEGTEQGQLDLPGTHDPNAVQNYETAVAHNTGTQNLGEKGNVGLEAHRTPNTFARLDALQLGDTITIKQVKTGTIYTYAVTQTMRTMPFVTAEQQSKATSVMDPIPFDDSSFSTPGHPAKDQPTKRLLTLTSCGLGSDTSNWRVYVMAELKSVTPGSGVK